MRKTILTLLGASLIAAATVQMASATQHHNTRSAAAAAASERARNSNAYAAPAEQEWPRYTGGGMSAPAGR
jgi:hypothetical protein